ncbi:MAG: hypothetical protein ABIS14_10645 [Sphingomonas sp.]
MKAVLLPILLVAQAAPSMSGSIDGLPLGALPKQELPARGCAAYLWSKTATPALVAMAGADPAQLRISIGGVITDLARDTQQGAGGFGFSTTTAYRNAAVTATLDMTIAPRDDLKDGAAVPEGTLRLDRAGQDSVVLPVAGLIGCAH